jgi:ribonuclease BN (tRNA processing enzyme)
VRAALLFAALLAASTPLAAQNCGEGIALQVLGSGGPDLGARRAAPSQLLWVEGRARVLIDAGGGSAVRLSESGAQLADLDVILFTSLGAGHTAEQPALVEAARLAGRNRTLPIYGPPAGRTTPSTVTFVRDLFDGARGAYRHLGAVLAPLTRSGFKLDPHDVRERPARIGAPRTREREIPLVLMFSNERLRITALSLKSDNMPVAAYRIEAGGKVIAVLGDAAQVDTALTPLLADADVLLAAHAVPEDAAAAARAGQLPPSLIGSVAAATRARQLVLAHRSAATHGREEESLAVIRRHYNSPVSFADDLACFRP